MMMHSSSCNCGMHAPLPPHAWQRLPRGAVLAGVSASAIALPTQKHADSGSSDDRRLVKGRILLRGGTIVSVDRQVGDFLEGDVLIEGERIEAVGPRLAVDDAQVVDASEMIVMPGFIDSHRHMWQGTLRNLIPNETLFGYIGTILATYGPAFRPDDVYIGDLVSALSALDGGVTTIVDWSHIQNSPEHAEAAIRALKESGLRAVFAYGFPVLAGMFRQGWPPEMPWLNNSAIEYPGGIARLRKQHFSTADQLLTLALGATGGFGNMDIAAREWAIARDVGARITFHAYGKDQLVQLSKAVELGPDTTYVHCSGYGADDWKLMADSGGGFSVSPGTEMLMDMGMPLLQAALDAGIRPTISIDAETNVPTAMFPQMQLCLAAQRATLTHRRAAGESNLPGILSVRDVIEFATIEGARACGLERKTGSLTPGKQADVILLRKNAINVMPINDPVGAIALGMDTSNVDTVFVAGVARKRGGQLVDVDLARILKLAVGSRDYLRRRVSEGD